MLFRSAPSGRGGNWLLDPTDIEIVTGTVQTGIGLTGTPPSLTAVCFCDTSQLGADIITQQLNAGASVTITTSSSGLGRGDITVSAPVQKTAGGNATLTLSASRDIIVNQAIGSAAGTLGLTLSASRDITVNAAVKTNGGVFNAFASTLSVNSGIVTGNGVVTVSAPTAFSIAAGQSIAAEIGRAHV